MSKKPKIETNPEAETKRIVEAPGRKSPSRSPEYEEAKIKKELRQNRERFSKALAAFEKTKAAFHLKNDELTNALVEVQAGLSANQQQTLL